MEQRQSPRGLRRWLDRHRLLRLVGDGNGARCCRGATAQPRARETLTFSMLDVNGLEMFPHNGVTLADDVTNRMRIWTAISLNASTGDIFMIAKEGNISPPRAATPSACRSLMQPGKQWGNLGIEVMPTSAANPSFG